MIDSLLFHEPDRELVMKFKILTIIAFVVVAGILFLKFGETGLAQIKGGRGLQSKAEIAVPAPANDRKIALYQWQTVVNNGYRIPGTGNATFSSYSQPSVNSNGVVTFRARSTGGQRATGIYFRRSEMEPIIKVADLKTEVPYPNNLGTDFREFSSIARIAPSADNIVMIGLHQPVYRYLLPDGTETRAGTTGLYAMFDGETLFTAASKLGLAPGFDFFAVPNHKEVIFDVFPGAPAITDDGAIAFKGNYTTDGFGRTGIFVRNLVNTATGGYGPAEMIVSSEDEIPNQPPSFAALTFDSTSPPTAVGNRLVFLGLDNEDDPHIGGIYGAMMKGGSPIELLVGIGQPPPGMTGIEITRIGESLAFDGRYLAFWAAWGKDTFPQRLYCPVDGNSDIIDFCNGVDPLSMYDKESDRWYQEKEIPINQGIFMLDTWTNTTYLAADSVGDFNDFVYWVYSGHIPAPDEPDAELPRWRGASFVALSEGRVVFKARTGLLTDNREYIAPLDGLYLGTPLVDDTLAAIIETGMEGAYFDPNVSKLFAATLPVVGVGIERDGFRGNWLTMTVSMADEENSWGGVYVTNVGGPRE